RLAGEPAFVGPVRSPFVDVSTSHVFYDEMAWLAEEEISRGYVGGDGAVRFDPSAPVLREQMAAFLYRLAGVDDPPPTPPVVEAVRDVSGTVSTDTVWGPGRAAVHRVVGDVTVADGVTLTLLPGTVVKFAPGRGLRVDGAVRVDGTAAEPVVLTSDRDDTAEGDTNGDGAESSPEAGDFAGVDVGPTGSLVMEHARVSYADTAVTATGTTHTAAEVALSSTAITRSTECVVASGPVDGTFTGSVRDCAVGVRADHAFDARSVDWGSPSGPSPFGTGIAVHGENVALLPWAGYSAPPRPPVAAPQPPPLVADCRDVVLVGVRGSGEFPQGPDPSTPALFWSDEIGFGVPNHTIATTVVERIRQQRPSATVKLVAVQYLALRVPTYDPDVDYGMFVDSVFDGVDKVRQLVEAEAVRCPSSRFVLIGASQGALVLHMALPTLVEQHERDRIAGVVLLANPARVAGSTETLWQSAGVPAVDGVRDASGSWTGFYPGIDAPIPPWAAARTITLCRQGDVVCAFRPGATMGPHLTYSTEDLQSVAVWQGARVAADLPED
ncbi:hypothetical protein HMPREF0063_12893, partial [Aeromicrobium marinum DSM 15272]